MKTFDRRPRKDESHPASGEREQTATRPYERLALAVGVHLLLMFALTFAGVNALDEVFVNLNRFYMAVLMVATMPIVMIGLMWHMFTNHRLNLAILAVSALVFVAAFGALRTETFVGNEQFLRSMIPHHSIAIHTCEHADIDDPEIVELCGQIIESQRSEIAQMREILRRIDG